MCLAIPGKLLEIEGEGIDRWGRVDFGGIYRRVNLSFAPDARVGEYVLTHVGFAIAQVDEVAADRVFQTLSALDLREQWGEGDEVLG